MNNFAESTSSLDTCEYAKELIKVIIGTKDLIYDLMRQTKKKQLIMLSF